jgi:hypothetical protein
MLLAGSNAFFQRAGPKSRCFFVIEILAKNSQLLEAYLIIWPVSV